MSSRTREIVESNEKWRAQCINLIASENLMPPAALKLLSTDFARRYTLPIHGEVHGVVAENAYCGAEYADALTREAETLARRVFNAKFADVRPISGHVSAIAALRSMKKEGRKSYMAVPVEAGGYDGYRQPYLADMLGLRAHEIPCRGTEPDMARFEERAREIKPDFIVLGQSVFLFPYDLSRFREVADELDAPLLYDASHVLGLIAGRSFQPAALDYCHCVYGSTHKTFPGPQGGIILSDQEDIFGPMTRDMIWSSVDNTHLNRIAALARTLELYRDKGKAYAKSICMLARCLAKTLDEAGVPMMYPSTYTRSHQTVVDPDALKKKWGTGPYELAKTLEKNNIITDAIGRFGTGELAMLKCTKGDCDNLVGLMVDALKGRDVKSEVKGLKERLLVGSLALE